MDSEVIERLEILYNSSQISISEMEKTIEAVKYVQHKYSIDVKEEIGGMFATHLAKSINRIHIGDGITCITKEVLEAVNDRLDLVCEANYILHDLMELQIVPEGEAYFTAMYIKLLLEA